MYRKFIILLLITAIFSIKMQAEWVSTGKTKTQKTPPKVTILSDDSQSTIVKVEISGFELKELIAGEKTYQSIDLLTEIFTTEAGSPELPYISKVLAVPDRAAISWEVLETGAIETFNNINLPPARKSWFEGQAESVYEEDFQAYQSNQVYPTDFVGIEPPSVFRDFRVARVSIFPLRYVAAKSELQMITSITVKINYDQGIAVNPKTAVKKAIAPSFGKLYRSFIFNYQNVLDNQFKGLESGHDVMLCIMPDIFEASFQPYAEWKRQSGTDVHITIFSDIGASATNPTIIQNHLADAYHNWEFPPTYVLIIGDNGVFPKKVVSYDYSFPNDDYFVEIDGNDHFPEMMIGRFTNQGDYRMQVMINKFMKYEKDPYVTNTDWFKKGIVCSNNAYESQVYTKRFTAELMMYDGGFYVDTLMSDGNWPNNCSMDETDVINAINEGRSYLNYRGEGWSSGWWANCTPLSTSDVAGFNNGEKLTFVTSIGCGVAMFDASGGNCFGEEWLQQGTLTESSGAVAFVGPTSNTHTTYNNKIDKGIYVGMFQEGMDTPGQALLRGKLYLYNVYGTDPWVEYHYRVFTVLGDPSIHIWKEVPLAVNVSHPSTISVGYNQLEFTVTFDASGLPVDSSQVCISGNNFFKTYYTDSTGKVYLDHVFETMDTLTITARGGNVIPYQGTMTVYQPEELVEPDGFPDIDDLDGNIDQLINPNENFNITFTLKNWGSQIASNVQATLSAADPTFVDIISTSPVSFGDMLTGESFTGNPFQFFVKPNCQVGQIITLQLHVTSSTASWDYYYDKEIQGCQLIYTNFMVYDEDATEINYRMDPGETVKLYLSIENIGQDFAPNVMGILTSNDQYITIIDSMATFETIEIGNFAINSNNQFEVSVDAACPIEYLANYSLKLYTQAGNYPYEIILDISIPVGLAMETDFTGPDNYGYYAYCSDDIFFEQAPVYEWFEIEGIGSQINIPSQSDFTEIVSLPFSFKYYGIDYNQLRISTDGWIAFGSDLQTASANTSLPNNDNVNCMVATFWDDLYDASIEEGEILYYYDNPNNRFIIEWDSIAHNDTTVEPQIEVFQAILLDPAFHQTASGDGEIIVQYKDVKDIDSLTVGIENHTQDDGLQYVFDNEYDATASILRNGFAIKFTTEPPSPNIVSSIGDQELENQLVSKKFSLEQNYPNPFSPYTWISYTLPEDCTVSLKIFDIRGQLIKDLQNDKKPAGKYSVMWNGTNNSGKRVSSGVYLYQIQTEKFTKTMKLFILN